MSAGADLLAELETLSFADRQRRIHAAGSALAGNNAELGGLIVELRARGGRYERLVAAGLAAAAGAVDQLAWAARDPDPVVARFAIGKAMPSMTDEQLEDLLPQLPLAQRRGFYHELRRGRRTVLADRLLPEIQARWGDADAAAILPAASPAVVADWLSGLGYAMRGWSALARRHPDAVLSYAVAELDDLDEAGRRRWWSSRIQLMAAIAETRPALFVRLMETRLAGPVPQAALDRLGRLLDADPAGTVRLLTKPGRISTAGWRPWLSRSQARRIAALDVLDILDLGRAVQASDGGDREFSGRVLDILRAVAPARRPSIVDGLMVGTDAATSLLSEQVLELLPRDRRYAEVRRMLKLRVVRADPDRTARLHAYLPFPEARRKLGPLTSASDADQRMFGYSLLIASAGRSGDPQVFGDLLANLDRLGNEQDRVRGAVVSALNQVPLGMFTAVAIDGLTNIRDGAVNARDLSGTTWQQIIRLAGRLLTDHPDVDARLRVWGAETATSRLPGSGMSHPWDLGQLRRLPAAAAQELFDAAKGSFVMSLNQDNAAPVMSFAEALGDRGRQLDGLTELVELVLSLGQQGMSGRAVRWLLASPVDRGRWLEKLLAWDRSVLTLSSGYGEHSFFDHLAYHRPDLLPDILAGQRIRGLFRTSDRVWVPISRFAATQWTTTQQRAYERLLSTVDLDQSSASVQREVTYARMELAAGTGPGIRELLNHRHPAVANTALAALVRSRKPAAAIRILAERLDDDQSVAAVPALSQLARWVPPESLATLLADLLQNAPKVTARKEAARLVAQYRVPGALDFLAQAWQRRGQHRDVKIAIAVAVTDFLDDPQAWQLVEASLADSPDAAVRLLKTDPDRLPPRHRGRFARLLTGLTRHQDPLVAGAACDSLGRWNNAAPEVAAELASMVSDLDCAQWRRAVDPLIGDGLAAGNDFLLPGLICDLATATEKDADAERDRDAQARQRLVVIGELVRTSACRWSYGGAALRSAIDEVRGDPELGWFAIRLMALDTRFDNESCTASLLEIADASGERPLLAARAVTEVEWVLVNLQRNVEPSSIQTAADRLTGRGDLSGGLLAVMLVNCLGQRIGWPASVRSVLRWLRRHPEPDVRAAAWSVFTVAE